jgi:CobQ-like glutamine amidotransferase family enzyme
VANTQKRLAQIQRDAEREEASAAQASKLQQIVEKRVEQIAGREPKPVKILNADDQNVLQERALGNVVITTESIKSALPEGSGVQQKRERTLLTEKMKSIVQVLEAFGVLEDLSYDKRELLITAIAEILGEN